VKKSVAESAKKAGNERQQLASEIRVEGMSEHCAKPRKLVGCHVEAVDDGDGISDFELTRKQTANSWNGGHEYWFLTIARKRRGGSTIFERARSLASERRRSDRDNSGELANEARSPMVSVGRMN
jgi:hypothetical protein